MDTLERFFALRYYPSRESFESSAHQFFKEERTTFVAAARHQESLPGKTMESDSHEELLESELVKPWVDEGSVAVWELPDGVAQCSSTTVRQLCQNHSGEELRQQLQAKVPPSIASNLVQENIYQ